MKAQQYHYPVGCDELSRGSDIRWPNLLVFTDSTCRVSMSLKKKNSFHGQPRQLQILSLYLSKIKKEFRNCTFKSAWRQSQESKTKCMSEQPQSVISVCPSVYIYIIPISLGFTALSWTVHCLPCHCTNVYSMTSKKWPLPSFASLFMLYLLSNVLQLYFNPPVRKPLLESKALQSFLAW